ncbi:MAG: TatD family hydrolase [Ilumatobacteraceae bacterium]
MTTPDAPSSVSPSTGLIDSHCHVHDPRIPDGTAGAVAAAHAAGVTTMITVGCDRATSLAAIDAAADHDGVHATVGLHPHDARHGVDTIVDLLDTPGIVAVGETGLDYYYEHSPRDAQRTAFAAQIQLAHERDLPLVIHTRDAWDDTFDVLDAEGAPTRTVFHCFTGGPDEVRRALALGAFVSFSGIVTFPSATDLHDAARRCPLDRTLVETDSPYLAPVPNRGKPNRPAWVTHVADRLATLHGTTTERVATTTRLATQLAFPGIRS